MTNEEALKILTTNEYDFGCGDCTWGAGQPKECDNQSCGYKQATEIAIETLEKQIPKKPFDKEFPGVILHYCPRCGEELELHPNFCNGCGQAIDWSE